MLALVLFLGAIAGGTPHSVSGDFDHDGKIDLARIVPDKSGAYRPIIRSGNRARSIYVIDTIKRDEVTNLFLDKMPHGRWRTWCGKGGEDGPRCRYRSVTIRDDVLTYGAKEATQMVALWTGKRFEVVLLSD